MNTNYDLTLQILSGLSELALDWNHGGYVHLPTNRPIRFAFQFNEATAYSSNLMRDLLAYAGKIHQSTFPSLPITVTDDVQDADAVVIFRGYCDLSSNEECLDFELQWINFPETPGSGSFHVCNRDRTSRA